MSRLSQLGAIRSAADAGRMAPLAAFGAYNGITDAFFTFGRRRSGAAVRAPRPAGGRLTSSVNYL